MDYQAMAEELLEIQISVQLASINQRISKLSQGMYFALQYLLAHGGAAHPRELSQGMSVSSARVAALLNRMEEQGLIKRSADAKDNRQIITSITEKGIGMLEKTRRQLLDDMAKTLEAIGPEDTLTYLRIRHKIAELLTQEQAVLPAAAGTERKGSLWNE